MRPELVCELYANHFQAVRGFLRTRHHDAGPNADDLAQDVFVRLLRYPDPGIENPLRFLLQVAKNVFYEWRGYQRNKKRHSSEFLGELDAVLHARAPEDEHADETTAAQTRAIIAKLPIRQQRALYYHVQEGLSQRQVAAKLGITHRMAMRDLMRAYRTLRAQCVDLGKEYGLRTDGWKRRSVVSSAVQRRPVDVSEHVDQDEQRDDGADGNDGHDRQRARAAARSYPSRISPARSA